MKLSFFSLSLLFLHSLTFSQRLNNTSIWKNYSFSEKRLPHHTWSKNTLNFYGRNSTTISIHNGDTLATTTKHPQTISNNQIDLIPSNYTPIYRHSFSATYSIINKEDTSKLFHKPQQAVTFSPNNNFISFVSKNNLYTYDINKNTTVQISTDGKKNAIINGVADWVHEEEFSFTKAYSWSKNENKIAYLQYNESEVPSFTLSKNTQSNYPEQITYKYPKVGEQNAKVKLIIYNVNTQGSITIGNNTIDEYILAPIWKGDTLFFQTLDRKQQTLKFISYYNNTFDTLYTENSTTYINFQQFHIQNNSLYYLSEKSGFNQLYQLNLTSKNSIQLTNKNSPIVSIIDIANNKLFYNHQTDKGINTLVSYFDIKKNKSILISNKKGNSELEPSPYHNAFILKHSTISSPPSYNLLDSNLNHVSTLVSNKSLQQKLAYVNSPIIETIKIGKNTELNTYTIYPNKFNKNKTYPVLIYVYGGPGYQTVENKWLGTTYAWHQHIAQLGYIVISIDPRGTGGKGKNFRDITYQQLGNIESGDIIKAVNQLSNKPYIDKTRIGIWGWSYGGYLTTRCLLTENSPFKTGIAVAPVTDWSLYDNIYTERFMGLDDSSYQNTSCLNKAHLLNSNFLLIHGTLDDNVHIQNTYKLQQKLIEANKEFDCFIYPNKNHGIYGGNTRLHLFNKLTNYIIKNL